MGIISAIKSALGLEDASQSVGGTDVTVEREPASSDREFERSEGRTGGPTDHSGEETGGLTPSDESTDPDAGVEAGASEDAAGDEESTSGDESTAVEGESVDSIKGIGSAYASRLEAAGVHTVDDLAESNAVDLNDATDIGEGRIERWIEQARAR